MIKQFYILLFSLLTVFSYGQSIMFQPNTNHKARKLLQTLNKTGDSLILESNKTIRQVDIFNKDFLKTIEIDSTKAKIDLNMLPKGNFIVKARLGRKRIVMYLKKSDDNKKLAEVAAREIKVKDNSDRSERQPLYQIKDNNNTLYWVVYESNTGFGSHKSMSLEYLDDIHDLIKKIKLELKSDIGKNNTLLVYEIYDRSKFMDKQLKNKKYYKSKKSKFFNVQPIYSSLQEKPNI